MALLVACPLQTAGITMPTFERCGREHPAYIPGTVDWEQVRAIRPAILAEEGRDWGASRDDDFQPGGLRRRWQCPAATTTYHLKLKYPIRCDILCDVT